MTCWSCNNNINFVNIISEYFQTGYLDGKTIVDYGDGDTGNLIAIECPKCKADLRNIVKEG
jgi:hypothetical protein